LRLTMTVADLPGNASVQARTLTLHR
jgi:hypothetical protein